MLDPKLNERILKTLHFEESDRIPVCDFIDHNKIFHYFSSSCALLPEKIKAYHGLGIDVCWRFERRQERRHEGFLSRVQKFALRRPRYSVLAKQDIEREFEDFRQQQQLFEPHTYLSMAADGCLSVVYRNLGFEEFSKKMYTELIEIERLIDIFAENLFLRAREFARLQLGPLFFIKDDIAYDKGLIFSAGFLRQQWLPRIKKAIEPLKESGKNIKIILHSQGDISAIIPGIIDAGIDGIHPLEPLPGMDMTLLKKTYGNSLLLLGTIDLLKSRREEVSEQIRKCVKNASNKGIFIGSSSGIIKEIPFQDVLSFFNATREI